MTQKHTEGPWEYVPSNENHGPYVVNQWGSGDICDCYTMSNTSSLAICNGGTSQPIHFQHDEADANARLIAAAPDLLAEIKRLRLAYVNLLEVGRDRILSLGGTCDPVDVMEAADPAIRAADAAILKAEGGQS